MNTSKKVRNLLGVTFMVLFAVPSCIPPICTRHATIFKNCTKDTLFIGASHYDNLDSVYYQLLPNYGIPTNNNLDTTGISLWKGIYVYSDNFVYPDSTCAIDFKDPFQDKDTCYFFLIKWRNAKRYSWDEIRTKKLFYRWIVTRNPEGKFDRNIRYK